MSVFEVGEFAYLARQIIEPACEDHPDFLMGEKGERVEILEVRDTGIYPYLVEGPTNKGKPWKACAKDLMMTKPFSHN